MLLICTSLIIIDVGHFFIYMLVIFMSLGKNVFSGVLPIFQLDDDDDYIEFKSFLYILNINPYYLYSVQTFLLCGWSFHFFIDCFLCYVETLVLCSLTCLFFLKSAFCILFKKILPRLIPKNFPLMCFLSNFMFVGIMFRF